MSLTCHELTSIPLQVDHLFPLPEPLRRAAEAEANRRGDRIVLSYTWRVPIFDPVEAFRRLAAWHGSHQLWMAPGGEALVAAGANEVFEAVGEGRFVEANAWRRELAEGALAAAEPGVEPVEPTLVGGFAFDPEHQPTGAWQAYPAAQLVLPEALFSLRDAEATLTRFWVMRPFGEGLRRHHVPLTIIADALRTHSRDADGRALALRLDDSEASAWQQGVEQVKEVLASGEAEKVVLARSVRAEAKRPIPWHTTLRRLAERHPGCYLFAVARGETCFLGATPELLVRTEGAQVESMALAGTAGRDADPQLDGELGEALLQDAKEREEHQFVVEAVREGIEPFTVQLQVQSEPGLRKLANVQHLYTPIRGQLWPDVNLLQLVERLHPTPAVGGHPGKAALEVIRRFEPTPRGWYAGPVGWMRTDGDGAFAVAIRSAVLSGVEAHLYVGCGIVRGSDVAREYAESLFKLNALLEALGGETE